MDLTQLANLGEFIGGVAVLVTLVYLAIQVSQTNRLTRAQVRQEAARMSNELVFNLGQDDLDLFAKAARDPQGVSESELRYVTTRFLSLANYYEMLFYAWDRGDVDDDLWQGRIQRMANFFGPAMESLWPIWKDGLGKAFQEYVEQTVLKVPPSQASWAR